LSLCLTCKNGSKNRGNSLKANNAKNGNPPRLREFAALAIFLRFNSSI
jgi:hypothetical protein